jgi:hypothetical protein
MYSISIGEGVWRRGRKEIVDEMPAWTSCAELGQEATLAGDRSNLSKGGDVNFDLGDSLCFLIHDHEETIRTAPSTDASANFTGSWRAIVGLYDCQALREKPAAPPAPLKV